VSAVRTSLAFSITVGIGYAACSLLFWLMPEAAVKFMNALFHGLDFRRLQFAGPGFSFGGFAFGLVVMVAWTFLLGTLFAWLNDRLSSRR
jgi:hypothetical protein